MLSSHDTVRVMGVRLKEVYLIIDHFYNMNIDKTECPDMIADILNAAERYSSNNAFVIDDVPYTYDYLLRLVNDISAVLSEITPDVIGIVAENDIETYAAILAVLRCGKTYVILHPSYPESRNRRIIQIAGIELVLCTFSCPQSVRNIKEADFICISQLFYGYTTRHAYKKDDEQNAYIIFTSGSTGEPKGVPISRCNLNAFYSAYAALGWHLDHRDRMLQMFELTFDVSVVSLLYPLTLGACVYPVGYKEVKYLKVFELLEKYELTFAAVAPSLLQLFSPFFDEICLPSLKYLVVTAEAAQAELLSRFRACAPNASFVNLYGPTEGTIYCTAYHIPSQGTCKQHNGMVAIGRPFAGIDVLITDDEGNSVPQGSDGELWISGKQVMSGYWKDEEKSALSIVKASDGKTYYKTGDICRMDADGDIIYCGRKDFQVKIQGFRVELSEIEYAARQFFENACNAVVIPKKKDGGYCELHLVVEKESCDTSNLEKHLKEQLPVYMLPRQIHCMKSFPLSTSNKVDRKTIERLIL